jgi:hypothetical protein
VSNIHSDPTLKTGKWEEKVGAGGLKLREDRGTETKKVNRVTVGNNDMVSNSNLSSIYQT